MRPAWLLILTAAVLHACKASTPSATSSDTKQDAPAQISGSMCDRVGGTTAFDGTCRCANGVAAFKLLGQTCAQMLERQTNECTNLGGQVLYDDGRCRCFPDYDTPSAGARCVNAYPQAARPEASPQTGGEDSPGGACVVLERATGKPQETCFDGVDLEGCERSFQVAFNQLKPEKYEMVLHPNKTCAAAKATYAAP